MTRHCKDSLELQSLLMRCKIRLLLSDNENALADAKAILYDLDKKDPMYSRGLVLQGDALFQMGCFEHALVIYHRGTRLRKKCDQDFTLGIQKATSSIYNALKHIKRKVCTWLLAQICFQPPQQIFQIKVDINVEDTNESKLLSRESYIFPQESIERKKVFNKRDSHTRRVKLSKRKPNLANLYAHPFKEDIESLTVS